MVSKYLVTMTRTGNKIKDQEPPSEYGESLGSLDKLLLSVKMRPSDQVKET